MNIFDQYLDNIKKTLLDLSKKGNLVLPGTLDGITAEIPPSKFDSDISTNVAMVLSKLNEKSPIDLANVLSAEIKEKDKLIDEVSVVKPGFINIKFKPIFWTNFIKEIIENSNSYGINTKEDKKKYLIEFVSANPTGPLHVGHCRGAILGDTLSRMLNYNGNKVVREYYVNDYGGQIKNFVLSVYYRILELNEEKSFPQSKNLYPGEYIIDIAKKFLVTFSENSKTMDNSALEFLKSYNWPGNIRELENLFKRVCALSTEKIITGEINVIKLIKNL